MKSYDKTMHQCRVLWLANSCRSEWKNMEKNVSGFCNRINSRHITMLLGLCMGTVFCHRRSQSACSRQFTSYSEKKKFLLLAIICTTLGSNNWLIDIRQSSDFGELYSWCETVQRLIIRVVIKTILLLFSPTRGCDNVHNWPSRDS